MLTSAYRVLGRASDRMKVAVIAAMIALLAVFHHPFSWLPLAAIISGGIDVLYPHIKRLVGLPDWTPNEAYITKLHRRYRTRKRGE